MTAALDTYLQKWNSRYSQPAYAYGKEPNMFFKEWLSAFTPGKLLLPAEGEGRNAVYAATLGWEVTAFDISEAGRNKALQLAEDNGVTLRYLVGSAEQLPLPVAAFDAIGLVYAHVAGPEKAAFHSFLHSLLRPGGVLVLEAFSKAHLAFVEKDPAAGGPKEADMLFSIEEIQAYFPGYEALVLQQQVVHLQEGIYHNGEGSVIRFAGRKR